MAARGARSQREPPRAPRGQHFLAPRHAASFVLRARVERDDVVLEIGAGTGRITRELAARAGKVIAVELDARLAGRLRSAFADDAVVTVVEADALKYPFPRVPYRVVANVPFAATTDLLRRLLDDPRSPLVRADLLVQWEVARKRSAVRPGNVLTLGWGPWWTFSLERRIPATCFRPEPRVDAGHLSIHRREPAMLDPDERQAYVRLLRAAFRRACEPLVRALPDLTRGDIRRLRRGLGFSPHARPIDLDVVQWVGVYREVSGRRDHRRSAE